MKTKIPKKFSLAGQDYKDNKILAMRVSP